MTMRYARKTVNGVRAGGGKKKKVPPKKPNNPVARWKMCNTAGQFTGRGEFVNGARTRKQAENNEIPRGHIHLENCDCLTKASGWDDNYSEEYLGMRQSAKAHDKRILAHENSGNTCRECNMLISISGNHYC